MVFIAIEMHCKYQTSL